MVRSIASRLVQLENHRPRDEFFRITVRGGFPEPEGAIAATAGQHRWLREEGETLVAFGDRAERLARAAGEPFVVFGGLPPYD